jgi:hypothetical protein
MNMEGKAFNYGRGGEGHVDIEKKSLETMEELKKGKLPEKEETVDLGAQLSQELDAELGEFTPEKIKAVAEEVRSKYAFIEDARQDYRINKKITGEELENLMDIAKNQALMASGVTNELQVINEALESPEIKRSKQILNTAIEHLNSL